MPLTKRNPTNVELISKPCSNCLSLCRPTFVTVLVHFSSKEMISKEWPGPTELEAQCNIFKWGFLFIYHLYNILLMFYIIVFKLKKSFFLLFNMIFLMVKMLKL